METESIGINELGLTAYDSDFLLKLRIGQRIGQTAGSISRVNENDDRVQFVTVYQTVAAATEQALRDDPATAIIQSWRQVHQQLPNLSIYDFVSLWYDLYLARRSDEQLADPDSERLLLAEVRSLYMSEEGNEGPFASIGVLNEQYDSYVESLERDLAEEAKRLQLEVAAIEQFDPQPPEQSRLELQQLITSFDVLTSRDAEHLFDQLTVSADLPLAVYTNGTIEPRKRFYKLHNDHSQVQTPFQAAWLEPVVDEQAIAMRMFTSGDRDERNYTLVTYTWSEAGAQLQVVVPIQADFDQDTATQRLLQHLPADLELSNERTSEIQARLSVLQVVIRPELFADMVMNDPVIQNYISIRETSSTVITNRRPVFNLNTDPGHSLRFVLENKESRINEPFNHSDGSQELLHEKTPYLQFSINASDELVAGAFTRLVPLLCARYLQLEQRLLTEYIRFIADFAAHKLQSASPSSVVNLTPIKLLENIAPNVFTYGYARGCQSAARQPRIIAEDQVEAWTGEKFIYRNREQPRQIMRFPTKGEDTERIYVCPDPANPFPGLVENRGNNAKTFPYVPCCFGSDDRERRGGPYGIYFRGETSSRIDARQISNIIETGKLAKAGQYGQLPAHISFLLQHAYAATWLRRGSQVSPSSLLHVIAALTDSQGVRFVSQYPTNSVTASEEFIRKDLRPRLANALDLAALRQELPVADLADIRAELLNGDRHFDSAKYFRVIEVVFGINLIIFTVNDKEPGGTFERPSANGLSLRPYLDPRRDTILLFKHTGGDADMLDHPQYELILHRTEDSSNFEYLVPPEVVVVLNSAIASVNSGLSWRFSSDGDLIVDHNANVILDLDDIFPDQLQGQYVDSQGKLRCLVYQGVPIITPPSRPLNTHLIEMADVRPVGLQQLTALILHLQEDGVKALLYSLNVDEQELVTGAWWYVGEPTVQTLFFTPINLTPLPADYRALHLNYLPRPNLFTMADESRGRYQHLSRVKYVLLQLLDYLLRWYMMDYNEGAGAFLQRYTVVKVGHVYEPSRVSRYFPAADSLDAALQQLDAPTFIEGGRLVLNSDELRKRLHSYLYVEIGKLEGHETLPIPKLMSNYYQSAHDFTTRSGTIIFDRFDKAVSWVNNLALQRLVSVTTRVVTIAHQSSVEPFVLQTSHGYYLVQNVLDGNLQRALAVTNTWKEAGVNIGFNIEANGSGTYTLFGVTAKGVRMISRGRGDNLLIRYANGHYAAMLLLTA